MTDKTLKDFNDLRSLNLTIKGEVVFLRELLNRLINSTSIEKKAEAIDIAEKYLESLKSYGK